MLQRKNFYKNEDISNELLNIIDLEDKKEMNQKRRYYRHNVSYEQLQDQHFYYNTKTLQTNDDIIDSILDFSETIENIDLYKALKKLKPCDIEIIKMRYVNQLSFKEIAEQLNMKEDTVGKRHRRALDKLRKDIFKTKNIK
ncbi:sigma-70 family RNA polymerase sigma factor [Vallitalea sp.]|jgi:RNA polymerase sigma factor (sigma-70 family)|uniref:sigma-70 family RNA polymerase sigma factor n=1 Tax=Vallitalea sp. TaxID=1882829 RepID=UPI0025D6F85C|nr:sigma-70 family RNA polymerase sigma factor [Vallitalea sp.]MCT4687542.1 sigma-70 family RNA polymerase sigma factor [Vallitalea sp.]